MRAGLKDVLLVDGYNVLNVWPELSAMLDNLEYARDKLTAILAGYGAFKDYDVTLVFDAHLAAGEDAAQKLHDALTVVYTAEGETADSYIERAAYNLVRQSGGSRQVYVVTSDKAEQMLVLGVGALRISARELRQDVKKAEKQMSEGFSEHDLNYRRQELGSRLDSDVLRRLDAIRRGG